MVLPPPLLKCRCRSPFLVATIEEGDDNPLYSLCGLSFFIYLFLVLCGFAFYTTSIGFFFWLIFCVLAAIQIPFSFTLSLLCVFGPFNVFTFCTTQRFWPCAVFFYFGPD
jgi:hypothetical protein